MNDLTTEQRRLAAFMSDLSEEGWYAGWMTGLEYALWDAMRGGGREYGHLTLTDAHLTRLRELSDACNGWIVFDDDTAETWVALAEWEKRFEAAQALRRPGPEPKAESREPS